jgi:uncharacterized membrane protein
LWLDELHTLAHASLPTLSEVLAHVRAEVVHQPLFFAAVHVFGGWEEGALLRALPVISSLLVFLPVAAFARRASGPNSGAALALWLVACLPYQVHWATELRPYAWLIVLSAGATHAAFAESGSRALRLSLFFACVAAGMLTHRLMGFVVFSIGAARLVVRSREMLPLWWLIVAGGLAVAPNVPWLLQYAEQAATDRFDYQDTHGGFRLRPALVKEALALPVRLVAPFLGTLGGPWSWLARAGLALFLFALIGALVNFVRRRKDVTPLPASIRALLWFAAIDFIVVFALSFFRWDRLPLQYFAPIAWIVPLGVAVLVERWPERSRSTLIALFGASSLAMGIGQAGGRSMEDMRSAVSTACDIGAGLEDPIFTALMSQPDLFEHTLPYRAYAPSSLERVEPELVPPPGQPGFERPLVVLQRGTILDDHPGWAPLRAGRRLVRRERVDLYLQVLVFEPAP